MVQEIFQPQRDVERRAVVGRTTINRDVLMFFTGQDRDRQSVKGQSFACATSTTSYKA